MIDRSRNDDDDDVCLGQGGCVARELEVLGRRQQSGLHLSAGILTRAIGRQLLLVEIEADRTASSAKGHRQGQSDVTESDDGDRE